MAGTPASARYEALRRDLLDRRRALPEDARSTLSALICGHIRRWPAFLAARRLALYLPIAGEVDVRPLFRESEEGGRALCLPRMVPEGLLFCDYSPGDALIRHPMGVLEPGPEASPTDLEEIDLFLVPGVAFDDAGGRLGFGRGYYDRGLAGRRRGAITLGVAYGFQIVPTLALNPWDVPMSAIVTERGVWDPAPIIIG